MSSVVGGQLNGRFSWPGEVIEAARTYTREGTAENLGVLEAARKKAAKEIVSLQASAGFVYLTDGGVGLLDAFTPYSDGVEGVVSGGNIDKYPGTRNSYYHTPVVRGKLKGGSSVERHLYALELEAGGKKKAILPSPASLALAAENSYYPNLEELMTAFAGVLREDVRRLEIAGYEMIQLNECFLTVARFAKKVGKEFVGSFGESIDTVFEGSRKRTCVYFHSGDASALLPKAADTVVTDLGFDFNTPPRAASKIGDSKNLILGLQNATRKLPDDWLDREPEELASRAREYTESLRPRKEREVFLCPSQDYDGLQTYPQAKRRLENLASAVSLLRGKRE